MPNIQPHKVKTLAEVKKDAILLGRD